MSVGLLGGGNSVCVSVGLLGRGVSVPVGAVDEVSIGIEGDVSVGMEGEVSVGAGAGVTVTRVVLFIGVVKGNTVGDGTGMGSEDWFDGEV